MKVLHITASNRGGAGIAALRLHYALNENGVQSAYLSKNLTIDFNNNHIKDNFFDYKRLSFIQRILKKIDLFFSLSKESKSRVKIEKVKSNLEYEIYTIPFCSIKLEEHPLVREADILNFHWMGGILNYPAFFEKCKKPIVWTMHDLSPIQGIFHYKNDVIRNKKWIGDLENELKKYKLEVLNNNIKAIVSPSDWLLQEVKNENLSPNIILESIPNCIDFDQFQLQNRSELRLKYDIKPDEFVLLFVADSLKNKRKGFDVMLEAVAQLENISFTVLTIGKGDITIKNQKVIALGEIHDASKMAEAYAVSNVFVLPSREDNLPNVMLESFACGTPVVSFNHGGMKDFIIENKTGILAQEISGSALANAIEKFYLSKELYDSNFIANFAKENFSKEKQASLYTKLYNKLVK